MTEIRLCRRCGAGVESGTPGGLCSDCLDLTPADGGTRPEFPAATGPFLGHRPAPAPANLAAHFPSLEILGFLGQGGMGTVYKARQVRLDRLVALKILSLGTEAGPFAERFLREARALARLNHPHVVTVHDFGEAGPLYYFVMEFVEGGSLRQRLQTGRPPQAEVLSLVAQMCDALQYAHDEGIVHRDIKPENVLLDRRGRIKIADFGLAKLLGPAPAFTLTASHQAMGTLHYVAPEQWEQAHAVDHRADLYALGVVFYELLTGELPLGRFPLPSERAPVDPRLDAVVLRTLDKDPHQRYQRAADLKADVEAAAAAGAGPVPGRLADTLPAVAGTPPVAPTVILSPEGSRLEEARRLVAGPAGGLAAAGVLSVLQPVFLLATLGLTAWTAVTLPGVAFGVIMVLAARRMRRLEAPEFALVGAILGLVPLGPAWAAGLPMGIWALLVLRKPEVRAAFAAPKPAAPPSGWENFLPRTATGWGVLCCALGMAASAVPWVSRPYSSLGQDPPGLFPVERTFRVPGFLTWSGLAAALLFLVLGTVLLAARRTWPPGVRRWTRWALSFARLLVCLAGVALFLFLVLLFGVVGIPGQTAGNAGLQVGAFLALALLLTAIGFVRGAVWRAVAEILTGLAAAGVVVLLFVDVRSGAFERCLVHSPHHGALPWIWTGEASMLLPGPVAALAAAAGLVVLGGAQLVRRRG